MQLLTELFTVVDGHGSDGALWRPFSYLIDGYTDVLPNTNTTETAHVECGRANGSPRSTDTK